MFSGVAKALQSRLERYEAGSVSEEISEHEDMFAHGRPGAMEHYLGVGREAAAVICRSLILADQDKPPAKILDLPCGGGRVARHLKALFPEGALYVGDVNQAKVQAVVEQFGAIPVDPAPDFTRPAEESFDLIWVGSLFTHFSERLYGRALRWFGNALAPDGILVMTTHGRRHQQLQSAGEMLPQETWIEAEASFLASGFGFLPYSAETPDLGTTINSPSWLARRIEAEADLALLGYQEAGWVNAHDVVTLQRRKPGLTLPVIQACGGQAAAR